MKVTIETTPKEIADLIGELSQHKKFETQEIIHQMEESLKEGPLKF